MMSQCLGAPRRAYACLLALTLFAAVTALLIAPAATPGAEPLPAATSAPATQTASAPAATTQPSGEAATQSISQPASQPTSQPTSQPAKEITLDLGNNVSMKLALIPAGKFMMGSPADDNDRQEGEGLAPGTWVNNNPQLEVTINKPFYMGVYDVTADQYAQFVKDSNQKNKDANFKQTGDFPVVNVSFDDAKAFCAWMSKKTGKTVQLPLEAVWEYACRAESNTRFSYGDDYESLDGYAWYAKNSDGNTHPVGQKKPNAWGLCDMHGNVMQWCSADSYSYENKTGPRGPTSAGYTVLRGGGFPSKPKDCRSTARYPVSNYDKAHLHFSGFRVVVDQPDPQKTDAQLEMDKMGQWWDRYWQTVAGFGIFAFVIILVGLTRKLLLWYREPVALALQEGGLPPGTQLPPLTPTTFRCGTLLYSKKGLMLVFAWLLWGDFCFNMMETIAGSIMGLKFKDLGADDFTMSLILTSLPAVFNIFVTPTISVWSDRVRSKWGRRLPFIIATMPFLTISLVLIAYCDSIGGWVHQKYFSGSQYDQAQVVIVVLAVCAGMFDLFNMFVGTVYWYLFNDVVPPELMGRFMAYFRLVTTLTLMCFQFFLFRYALSHMRELYLGAAAIYLIGFGAMCLRVKESDYPPPEDAGPKTTFRQKTKHILESMSISHYVYWTLEATIGCLGGGFNPFYVFLNISMGLTLGNIGVLNGVQQLVGLLCFLFVGKLVDRWNSVRVVAYLGPFGAFFCLGGWIWLYVAHPSPLLFMLLSGLNGLFAAPAGAINGIAGLPRVFALLPREKFGQYNGAMCMIRAAGGILLAGLVAGLYLKLMRYIIPPHADDPNWLYRCMFPFTAVTTIASTFCSYKVYRGWKRLGGDKSYVPPVHKFRLRDLPPHPDVDGKVNWSLLAFACVQFAGTVLGSVAWVSYYIWWNPHYYYAKLFALAGGINLVMFFVYLRFVKFMERP